MKRGEHMSVLVFDWGGTGIKHGLWKNDRLEQQEQFPTPKTWQDLKNQMKAVKDGYSEEDLEGVAISAPGAVNSQKGVIEGISAIPYIHHFPIQAELEAYFGLPVAFENDANSAGMAEVWKGAAREYQDVLFLVLGTGVGGAVIKNGQVEKGAHLYGGEFGLIYLDGNQTFSGVGTAVKMADRYCLRHDLEKGSVSGEEVFRFATEGDEIAAEEVENFYNYVARGVFSLQFTLDPECIVIGGGVSAKPGLLEEVNRRVLELFADHEIIDFEPVIRTCEFKNDANLIGAVANFYQQQTHS